MTTSSLPYHFKQAYTNATIATIETSGTATFTGLKANKLEFTAVVATSITAGAVPAKMVQVEASGTVYLMPLYTATDI